MRQVKWLNGNFETFLDRSGGAMNGWPILPLETSPPASETGGT
jgi:hypothetical protein